MSDRDYEEETAYRDHVAVRTLSPAAPAVIWGAVMVAALTGAGLAVWGAPSSRQDRIVDAGSDVLLRRDVAKLGAERDALAGRLAMLEREVAAARTARREADAPETTASIARTAPAAPPTPLARVGLSLGTDPSPDAAKRRWSALAARFPQLANLAPKVQRAAGATPRFDLVAGPFANRADAERACAALAEQGLACDTTDYAGDPIGRL